MNWANSSVGGPCNSQEEGMTYLWHYIILLWVAKLWLFRMMVSIPVTIVVSWTGHQLSPCGCWGINEFISRASTTSILPPLVIILGSHNGCCLSDRCEKWCIVFYISSWLSRQEQWMVKCDNSAETVLLVLQLPPALPLLQTHLAQHPPFLQA